MIKKKDIMLAVLSGALLVFAFPPFDLYPLAWIALIPLLISVWGKELKASFILGLSAGFIYFIGTIYWIFNPIYYYSSVPAVLSILLVAALCLYLGSYVGIFSMLFNYLSRYSRLPSLLIIPVIWVALEVLRTYALTGFPWSLLGYSQYKFLPLIQIADITGVYGVSFLVATFNGAIFDLVIYGPRRLNTMPLVDRWPMTIGLAAAALIIALSLSYGVWRLKTVEKGQTIRASVIQGNFEQNQKWDAKFYDDIKDTYRRLSKDAVASSPDFIVWPETAVPFVFGYDEPSTAELVEFQKTLGTYLLFGTMLTKDVKDNKYELSNSAVLMSPGGEVKSTYDKIHLVPYGEYVPLRNFSQFIEKFVAGIGDFRAGNEHTVMDVQPRNNLQQPARIGNLICYEIIFPGLVRKFSNNGANLLVTITNDAWFGRSSAPYQHFSMAVFRAVENRAPVVRAANTGISGFIDAKGRIIRKSDIFVRTALTENIRIGSFKKTFYTAYGDLFAFLCIISCVLLIANNIYPKKARMVSNFYNKTYGGL
jgi:apolipoprotein N-acyltransferase